jgi:hypothetical protein
MTIAQGIIHGIILGRAHIAACGGLFLRIGDGAKSIMDDSLGRMHVP